MYMFFDFILMILKKYMFNMQIYVDFKNCK
jgi:hypothetical protein